MRRPDKERGFFITRDLEDPIVFFDKPRRHSDEQTDLTFQRIHYLRKLSNFTPLRLHALSHKDFYMPVKFNSQEEF
jgi:hypothetical protein